MQHKKSAQFDRRFITREPSTASKVVNQKMSNTQTLQAALLVTITCVGLHHAMKHL